MVLACVVIHVLARVLPHVLARVLLHVLARVIIHVHDYYLKTCPPGGLMFSINASTQPSGSLNSFSCLCYRTPVDARGERGLQIMMIKHIINHIKHILNHIITITPQVVVATKEAEVYQLTLLTFKHHLILSCPARWLLSSRVINDHDQDLIMPLMF